MEIPNQTNLRLSSYELWYLLSLMPPVTVIGLHNPVAGMLVEDIFPLVQEASYSLLDRDLIHVDAEMHVSVKHPLSEAIQTLASAHHTLLVGHKLQGESIETTRTFNFDNNNVVLLEESVDETCRIEVVHRDDILPVVTEVFVDRVFWAPDTDSLMMDHDTLVRMQEAIGTGKLDQLEGFLQSIDGDGQSKDHFLDTLQNAIIRFSFVAFFDRDKPGNRRVDGFSIVAGKQYIWLMEIVDEEKKVVSVSKISLKDLNKKILSFLVAMLGG